MKTLIKAMYSISLILLSVSLLSFDLPEGWYKAGSKPKSYEMGIDKGAGQDGKNAATIKSIEKKINGFGTLMQQSKPGKFIGKRIKMTGYVKSENVKKWAGLWLRVDETGSKKELSFDNMVDRPIKGTTAWKKYEIVVDVPNTAALISYGALIYGSGQIWFDKLALEIVADSVKTTGLNISRPFIVNEPFNLDFEK